MAKCSSEQNHKLYPLIVIQLVLFSCQEITPSCCCFVRRKFLSDSNRKRGAHSSGSSVPSAAKKAATATTTAAAGGGSVRKYPLRNQVRLLPGSQEPVPLEVPVPPPEYYPPPVRRSFSAGSPKQPRSRSRTAPTRHSLQPQATPNLQQQPPPKDTLRRSSRSKTTTGSCASSRCDDKKKKKKKN